jgi:acyl carrier protein
MMTKNRPNLIAYFQELGFPTDNLSDQATLSHDLGLELADFEQLIQYLENSFRVCIPVQDQIYLITLGDVRQLLRKR